MINQQLISPKHIAVIGASENTSKPGGKVLQNLLDGGFNGKIYAVNPKPVKIPKVIHYSSLNDLPETDLAILSIPAKACLEAVKVLAKRNTKAFILFSAGFGEAGVEGEALNKELIEIVNRHNACLVGPNCIGVINENYKGVFTTPVPDYHADGCELISSSGATSVFIMEAAMSTGLRFSNVYSIGNAAQTGVEELLEFMDKNYVEGKSPKVKLLYLEHVKNPFKFLKHAASLIRKGCKIAAIKAGFSEAGGRAASSHTGAMATSDTVIRALFKKAGIVYCSGREELITIACIFQSKELKGENIAVITHAGGSAVMLTDALTSGGLKVPQIEKSKATDLLKKLHPGSSVENPIDFLATGTAAQLGDIIDFCEKLDNIDAMIVVFGSPGLFQVKDVYELLDKKMQQCNKPIYPVLPSLINAKNEIAFFLSKGRINFPDEVILGKALPYVYFSPKPTYGITHLEKMADATIRSIISQSDNGYLSPDQTRELLQATGISVVKEKVCTTGECIKAAQREIPFPIAMKVIGPLHKTEVGGVSLNIHSNDLMQAEFDRLMQIPDAKGVLVQQMLEGEELFVGAIRQTNFGHLVVCGLGGIFVEVLKDIAYGLAPLSRDEAKTMIRSLKGYKIIEGYRSGEGVNEELFIDAIVKIASLVHLAPEISELDINPFIANQKQCVVADARVNIER